MTSYGLLTLSTIRKRKGLLTVARPGLLFRVTSGEPVGHAERRAERVASDLEVVHQRGDQEEATTPLVVVFDGGEPGTLVPYFDDDCVRDEASAHLDRVRRIRVIDGIRSSLVAGQDDVRARVFRHPVADEPAIERRTKLPQTSRLARDGNT